jgi:signal transduction histidine kinase
MQQIGSEMWVNTFNYGIFVLNVSESPVRILRHITAKDGLPGNSAYAALPDSRGFVWIPHNSGLSRYQPQNNQFIHFSVSEGLQDEEFNRLAFFKNHQGEIILGGINGINIFDPEKLVVPETELNLRLVGVRTLEVQSRGVQKSFYHPFGNEATVLSLPSGQNYLQFDFFPVSYREPARYTLSYRLEPFEKNWVATEDFTSHAYVNLAPGSYTFSVRAQSYDGEERTATVQFNIQTPYWKTWWFMLLTAGITSFLVFTIIYARVKNSRAETEKLTALLNERTREIQNSREELENLNRKKDFIFSILSHDLRSPLTTLKGFLSLLIENTEVISKDELRRHAIAIRNSVTNSLDLIDNTLFWSLSQTGNIQCKPQPVVLQPILEKIKGLYQLTAEKKKINLMLPPVEAVAVADENMLYVVLRNLVSNALKFTPEGKSVFVTCSTQHTRTFIRVRDEGIGMTPEEVGKIFSLSQPHIKKGTGSEKGTGLGLLLCKKFIDQNGGMLEIESEPGQGSTFTVSLPAA